MVKSLSKSLQSEFSYAQLGNFIHIFLIFANVSFGLAVLAYANPKYHIFDHTWIGDGFCVTNKDIPYWNSLDLCLYVDTLACIVLAATYVMTKDIPGMEISNNYFDMKAIFGIFVHGVAHGFQAKVMRGIMNGDDPNSGAISTDITLARLFQVVFWVGLLKAAGPTLSYGKILFIAFFALCGESFLLPEFNFAYVQTILLVVASIVQISLSRIKKTFEYATFASVIALPLFFVSLIESTHCSEFVIRYGGHVIYDAYIPCSLMVFRLLTLRNSTKLISTDKKTL